MCTRRIVVHLKFIENFLAINKKISINFTKKSKKKNSILHKKISLHSFKGICNNFQKIT